MAAAGAPSDPEAVLRAFAQSGAGSKADVSKARQRFQAARMLRAQDDQARRLASQQQRQSAADQLAAQGRAQRQQRQMTADQRAAEDRARRLERQGRVDEAAEIRKAAGIGKAAGALADNRPKPIQFLDEKLGTIPTPGGVGIVLVILLIFIFAIVPVNQGYTRLQLFWLTLLGRTELPESKRPTESAGGGAAQPVVISPGSGYASNTQQPIGVSGANETPNLVGAVRQAVVEAEGLAGNILPQLPFGLPR